MVLPWGVRYVDGSWFTSDDGEPQDAPGGGVAAVVQADETVNLAVHHGCDFYVYDLQAYGGWAGVDHWGLVRYVERPGFKVLKFGEMMPTPSYRALLAELKNSASWAPKTSWYPWERRV